MKSNMRYIYHASLLVLLLALSCSNSPTGPNTTLLLDSDLVNDGANAIQVFTTGGIGSNVGAAAGFSVGGDENTRGVFFLHWHPKDGDIVGAASAHASGPIIRDPNSG